MKTGKMLLSLLAACWCTLIQADNRTIHVLVALYDNLYQGAASVSPSLSNGQAPEQNLYWGAPYGFKAFWKQQPEWTLLQERTDIPPPILERAVFQYRNKPVFLIADAYDGRAIRQATADFFNYSSGLKPQLSTSAGQTIRLGGDADLVIYLGHNGLLDFPLQQAWQSPLPMQMPHGKQCAILADNSHDTFAAPLLQTGCRPLLLIKGTLAAKGPVAHALLTSWLRHDSAHVMRDKIARSYQYYQTIDRRRARELFATE